MSTRASERIEAVYAIAQHRAAYSPEEDAVHELARDGAGNLFGSRGDARVWAGSHLDSVPTAGRFDGVLGVVAAIEAADRLRDRPLAVVAFRAEESGPMGSEKIESTPEAYLEVHIEQGPVLERLGEPLAVVTAIGGQARGTKVFEGRADHAGTTPMAMRSDALVDAAQFILHVRDSAGDDAVATVGAIEVEPNAGNVVPARVTVAIDARSSDPERLRRLVADIGFEPRWIRDPTPMGDAFAAVLPDAPRLVSGAGHDAMFVPNASMLFVRSLNGGVSHHPDELSSEADIELAIDALTAALDRLTA